MEDRGIEDRRIENGGWRIRGYDDGGWSMVG